MSEGAELPVPQVRGRNQTPRPFASAVVKFSRPRSGSSVNYFPGSFAGAARSDYSRAMERNTPSAISSRLGCPHISRLRSAFFAALEWPIQQMGAEPDSGVRAPLGNHAKHSEKYASDPYSTTSLRSATAQHQIARVKHRTLPRV